MTNQTEKNTDIEQGIVKPEETQEEQVVEQAEIAENEAEESDPLADAIMRVQDLEAYIADADKREKEIELRARAEIDNIRRRAEQDVEKAHKFALEKFTKELLTVVDNLERGLDTLKDAGDSVKTLVEGVELTHKDLLATLAKFGVESVGVVGEVFNPEHHQAISMQPAEGIETNHLSAVLQKGYTLHGRIIRPAMVMVAS